MARPPWATARVAGLAVAGLMSCPYPAPPSAEAPPHASKEQPPVAANDDSTQLLFKGDLETPFAAIVNDVDIRRVEPSFEELAASTVAIHSSTDAPTGQFGASVAEVIARKCEGCTEWSTLVKQLIRNAAGAVGGPVSCSAVLVRPNVVATIGHCVNFTGHTSVVFDFVDGKSRPRRVVPQRVCREKAASGEKTWRLLRIHEPEGPSAPQGRLAGSTLSVAFGHPLGLSRLMSGAIAESKIKRCRPGRVRAVLDSLDGFSGGPVFARTGGSKGGEWRMVGVVWGRPTKNEDVHCEDGICRLPWSSDTEPCGRGNYQLTVAELTPQIVAAMNQLQAGKDPPGWDCVGPAGKQGAVSPPAPPHPGMNL